MIQSLVALALAFGLGNKEHQVKLTFLPFSS